MVLSDQAILDLLRADPDTVHDLGVIQGREFDADSPVQPSSVDLTIGNIYIPETDDDRPGGLKNPLTEINLRPGQTDVVENAQRVKLTSYIAGIGFPPDSVSSRGLLTTNPGHVDPGFSGRLKLTVINMGRIDFMLKRGDVILTLLLLSLDKATAHDWQQRHPVPATTGVSPGMMLRLSADFLQVDERAKNVARKASIWIPLIVALVTLVGTFATTYLSTRSGVED